MWMGRAFQREGAAPGKALSPHVTGPDGSQMAERWGSRAGNQRVAGSIPHRIK